MSKYVIFDLDETLGYFTELGVIWGCLQKLHRVSGQAAFNSLCSLFENDYFRPGIFSVLKYLKSKESTVKVVLYTNNTGSLQWLKHIISFLEERSEAEGLFSKIIPGYRKGLDGPRDRRTYEKTYREIIRCANIPKTAKIIFFDDVYHEKMVNQNVKYVQVKPYLKMNHSKTIIDKLQKSCFSFINYSTSMYLYECIHQFHYDYANHAYHANISKKNIDKNEISKALIEFLKTTNKTTKKRDSTSKRKTKKKYI
jgi:hypothetical protein